MEKELKSGLARLCPERLGERCLNGIYFLHVGLWGPDLKSLKPPD